VEFATSTTQGTYFNRAQMLGYHRNTNPKYMKEYDSMVATVPVNVGFPTPIVLGISTTTECTPYLTSFLKQDQTNNISDVRRLQAFLGKHNSLSLPITGYFDNGTAVAVKKFQEKYKEDVLTPWGLNEPTGHVYYTTQKTINEIQCAYEKPFPLTLAQTTEMERYKKYNRLTVSTPAVPKTPAVPPIASTHTTQPKKELTVVTSAPINVKPPTPKNPQTLVLNPKADTATSMQKRLSQLLSTGTRTIGWLKFW
jgi:peptidoglycan hydrolase-like protein with peptidoglycan-binding domain